MASILSNLFSKHHRPWTPLLMMYFVILLLWWSCHVFFLILCDFEAFNSLYTAFTGEGNGTPLQYSCLENPMDGGAWWAAVHGVVKSRTWLSNFTFTFHFHALEKEMATHSGVLAWRIPGMVEPGGLPSMGSHRVGHDWSYLAVRHCIHKHSSSSPHHQKPLSSRANTSPSCPGLPLTALSLSYGIMAFTCLSPSVLGMDTHWDDTSWLQCSTPK